MHVRDLAVLALRVGLGGAWVQRRLALMRWKCPNGFEMLTPLVSTSRLPQGFPRV